MKPAMKPYIVRLGDYLTKIAVRHRFDADEVWNCDKNATLRASRSNPEMLCRGDLLYIPTEKSASLPVKAGASNTYRVNIPSVTLNLHFQFNGSPMSGEDCIVSGLRDAQPEQTDGDGCLEVEVSISVEQFSVYFPERKRYFLVRPGYLGPENQLVGITSRLRNLGFLPTPAEGENKKRERDRLRLALQAFQASHNMEPTGILDDDTRAAIVKAHGS